MSARPRTLRGLVLSRVGVTGLAAVLGAAWLVRRERSRAGRRAERTRDVVVSLDRDDAVDGPAALRTPPGGGGPAVRGASYRPALRREAPVGARAEPPAADPALVYVPQPRRPVE